MRALARARGGLSGRGFWAALAAFSFLALAGCGDSGSPVGAPCSSALQCASHLCLQRATGSVCAQRCTSSRDCTGGDVCGSFDFGPSTDPDASPPTDDGGTVTDPSDTITVCRPPLSASCDGTRACPDTQTVCTGTPGVCSTRCGANGDCLSGLCLPAPGATSCGPQGVCAPLCDEGGDCPQGGWFCNLVGAPRAGHGRCEPVAGADGSVGEAGVCQDAAPVDSSSGDSSSTDASMDAAVLDGSVDAASDSAVKDAATIDASLGD